MAGAGTDFTVDGWGQVDVVSEDVVAQAKELLIDGVTAGPWKVSDDWRDEITVGAGSYLDNPGIYKAGDLILEYDVYGDDEYDRAQRLRDARFIAASRELVPALVAMVEISRLSSRTAMYHNALIVALRTTGEPLSAPDLVAHMPWTRQTRPHPGYRGKRCAALPQHRSDHGRILRCDGISHVIEVRPAGYQLYGFLCRLERDGVVARAAGSVEGRRILWELTERGRASADIDDVRRIVEPGSETASPADGETELRSLAAAAEEANTRYLTALRAHLASRSGADREDSRDER